MGGPALPCSVLLPESGSCKTALLLRRPVTESLQRCVGLRYPHRVDPVRPESFGRRSGCSVPLPLRPWPRHVLPVAVVRVRYKYCENLTMWSGGLSTASRIDPRALPPAQLGIVKEGSMANRAGFLRQEIGSVGMAVHHRSADLSTSRLHRYPLAASRKRTCTDYTPSRSGRDGDCCHANRRRITFQ